MSKKDFTFTDTKGRDWFVPALNYNHVKKLNEDCGIKVSDLIADHRLWQSDDDTLIIIGATLWKLCGGQHQSVSEEAFFEAFDGDTFEAGQEALGSRLANFSQSRKAAFEGVLSAVKEATKTSLEELAATAKKIGEEEPTTSESSSETLSTNASKEPEKRGSVIPDLSHLGS